MLERRTQDGVEWTDASVSEDAQLRINVLRGRTIVQVHSWIPEGESDRTITLDGREPPSQVGATLSGPTRVLCVGPTEWLVVSDAAGLHQRLISQLRPPGLAIVDSTQGFAILQVDGSAARDLLSKGCGLDLHPRYFPPGQCARTRFAQAPLVIDCLAGPSRFELYVARSYLTYLCSWLADAALELKE